MNSELLQISYISEFKTFKLNGMLRDVKKLSTEELILVKKEIEKLLLFEASKYE